MGSLRDGVTEGWGYQGVGSPSDGVTEGRGHRGMGSPRDRVAAGRGSLTFCGSSRLTGMLPPLKISHRVAPKPHLSAGSARPLGSLRHSGATQGMRSTSTGEREQPQLSTHRGGVPWHLGAARALTVLGQDGDADTGVVELDEGGAAAGHVPLPGQQHLLGGDVAVGDPFVLLGGGEGPSAHPRRGTSRGGDPRNALHRGCWAWGWGV